MVNNAAQTTPILCRYFRKVGDTRAYRDANTYNAFNSPGKVVPFEANCIIIVNLPNLKF